MYKIPTAYSAIFRDRVLIITGVGRSGTTILGKLIGSMKPTVYLFEPAIMKYMFRPDIVDVSEDGKQIFLGTLFEDYFLPLIQGRYNDNIKDDSFFGHYWLGNQNLNLPRRSDALEWIKDNNPLFVIKTNEAQPHLFSFPQMFKGCEFLHVVRNGNDVIQSTLKKGWYINEYMKSVVDWVNRNDNSPWYLAKDDKGFWKNYNQETRIACVWRSLTGCSLPHFCRNVITYERIINGALFYLQNLMSCYKIKKTNITGRHIQDIAKYKHSLYPLIINQLQEPERGKTCELMQRLGYPVQ